MAWTARTHFFRMICRMMIFSFSGSGAAPALRRSSKALSCPARRKTRDMPRAQSWWTAMVAWGTKALERRYSGHFAMCWKWGWVHSHEWLMIQSLSFLFLIYTAESFNLCWHCLSIRSLSVWRVFSKMGCIRKIRPKALSSTGTS